MIPKKGVNMRKKYNAVKILFLIGIIFVSHAAELGIAEEITLTTIMPNTVSTAPDMVYGTIGGNGVKTSGEGFTSARIGSGLYKITFDTAFAAPPAATVTLNDPSPAHSHVVILIQTMNENEFTYYCGWIGGVVGKNYPTSFIVVGQR